MILTFIWVRLDIRKKLQSLTFLCCSSVFLHPYVAKMLVQYWNYYYCMYCILQNFIANPTINVNFFLSEYIMAILFKLPGQVSQISILWTCAYLTHQFRIQGNICNFHRCMCLNGFQVNFRHYKRHVTHSVIFYL
jgi:hypothetical protein